MSSQSHVPSGASGSRGVWAALQERAVTRQGRPCIWAAPTAIISVKIKPIYLDADVTGWLKTTQWQILHLLLRWELIDTARQHLYTHDSSSGEHSTCSVIFLNVPISQGESAPLLPKNAQVKAQTLPPFTPRHDKAIRALYHCPGSQLWWIVEMKYLGMLTTQSRDHRIFFFLIPERIIDFFWMLTHAYILGKKSQRTMDGTKCFGTPGSERGSEVGEGIQSQRWTNRQHSGSGSPTKGSAQREWAGGRVQGQGVDGNQGCPMRQDKALLSRPFIAQFYGPSECLKICSAFWFCLAEQCTERTNDSPGPDLGLCCALNFLFILNIFLNMQYNVSDGHAKSTGSPWE